MTLPEYTPAIDSVIAKHPNSSALFNLILFKCFWVPKNYIEPKNRL